MAADAKWESRRRLRREKLRLAFGRESVNDLVETLPFHDPIQRIESEVDAMVGDPPLREIIGSDALRPVAGADLGAPGLSAIGVELLVFGVEDARA